MGSRGRVTGAKLARGKGHTRSGNSGEADPLARFGSGKLSLADRMGPPPAIIRGRGNGSEVTPDRLGLSRGPTYKRSASLPAWLITPGCDYTRLFRMKGPLLRLRERSHVSIRVPGGRTHNPALAGNGR